MKRPLIGSVIYYIIGLIIIHEYQSKLILLVLTILFLLLMTLALGQYKSFKGVYWLLIFTAIAMGRYHLAITEPEVYTSACEKQEKLQLEGYIKQIKHYDDYDRYQIQVIKPKKCGLITYVSHHKVSDVAKIGQYVSLEGVLQQLQQPRNPGAFNEEIYYRSRGIDYKFKTKQMTLKNKSNDFFRFLDQVSVYLGHNFETILPEEEAGIIKTMLLGNDDALPAETKKLYQDTGIAHVLAISGLHVGLIVAILTCLLKKIGINERKISIIIILFLLFYVALSGMKISTCRAAIMVIGVLVGKLIHRKSDAITSVGTAALILLIYNPFYLWDIGFQLSFVAVIGLILMGPLVSGIYVIPEKIRLAVGASLIATVVLTPLTMYYFFKVTPYSFLVNLIVVPLMTIVILFSGIGGLFSIVSPLVGKFFIGIVYYILQLYKHLCNGVLHIPGAIIHTGKISFETLILYYTILGVVTYYFSVQRYASNKTKRNLQDIILLGVVLISVNMLLFNTKHFQVTFLDVGQGDAAVIRSESGRYVIVDGGPSGRKDLLPYLQYEGVTEVDSMFLSHSDQDHIKGLEVVLDEIAVKHLYVVDRKIQMNNQLKRLIKKAKEKHIKVIYMAQGDITQIDGINFNCLWPNENRAFDNNNNSSMVLDMDYKGLNILFTGDIEKETEELIVSYNQLKTVDVLKIPHHGSKTSSTDGFIDSVLPTIGIISSDKDGKFKHPNEEVVKRYNKKKIPLFMTTNQGAIFLTLEGDEILIDTFCSEVKHDRIKETN